MGSTSSQRSTFAQSAFVYAITLAALTSLCAVLAYWTWIWLAPRPAPRAPAIAETQPRILAAYTLFGGAAHNKTAAAPTALAIKLLGVVAAAGATRGYAVVQLEANRILAVREGNDIAPGI